MKLINACPLCGSTNQIRSIIEDHHRMVRIQCHCENCLQEFEDCYQLVRQEWEVW